jgi:pyruvate/oxaloacetate carboxyltransferase
MARNEDDVLTYALFPEIAKDFFLWRDAQEERQQANA